MIVDADLKLNVINEYFNLIKNMELGYSYDYSNIIIKILYIQSGIKDVRLYEYLVNN